MDYIRFSVDGQRLDYDRKYYSSTDTIDTLYCNFKFETDDLGHILGGWDLPYLWAQFHDEEGNVYIKQVENNTCSIPHKCLRQLKFKMTLFATDKEDYMTCEKRYTTNEIAFKFKGRANINYDGGVSPDEPMPSNWQILLDRVDECESSVDTLSQSVSAMESTVDTLSQDVSAMDDKVDGIDGRVTTNTNTIDDLSQDVTSMHGTLDDLSTELNAETTARETADTELQSSITAESTARATADTRLEGLINNRYTKAETDALLNDEATARENADTNLQSLINDRYTKAETDALIDTESTARTGADTRLEELISDEVTAREKLENEDIPRWFTEESNHRINGDNNLQSNINSLDTRESNHYSTSMSRMNELDSRVTGNSSAIGGLNTRLTNESTARTDADTRLEGLIDDEKTARENADANLQLLINDETNERASGDNALQQSINALDDTVTLLYKTLKKDNSWNELAELVRSGKAEQFLNYGDQIEENWIDVDNNNKEYSNPWDIAKFEDVETREGIIKGMFLKTHWATLRPIQFSHNRAFYACRDGLSAGTYYITLGADWGTNAKKDKSYQFTLTNDVPVGGKLAGFYSMPDVVPSNWKVYVYDENGIDILENAITVTEGTDGTSLGTLKFNTRDGNLNSMQETAYGNNDWEISAYRQYLNSREGKGEWWTAQDEWDIAPDQLKTVSGFLCGISDELYNSMQTVKVKTWKNNPTHGGVESYTYDKVFLPSKEELYYTPQKAGEGTYYPLMKEQLGLDSPLADYTNYVPNITYAIENHSSAQVVRLRSALLNYASYVWFAFTSGYVHSNYAAYAYRCTPVCVIG